MTAWIDGLSRNGRRKGRDTQGRPMEVGGRRMDREGAVWIFSSVWCRAFGERGDDVETVETWRRCVDDGGDQWYGTECCDR